MSTPIWNEKEGRWVYRVTLDGITKKFTSTKKGIAGKRIVLDRAKNFEQGLCVDKRTVADEWERFIADVGARSSASNTYNVAQTGRLYFPSDIYRRTLRTLHLTDFQAIINGARKKDGSPLAKKTLSNIRAVIVSFLNYARVDGATDIIPTGLYIPKVGIDRKEKTILQPEHIQRIFSNFNDEYYINLWRLMLVTGMRPGEALGLQWSDIKDGRIYISRSINRKREITDGKNKNARRMIPVSAVLEKVLADQKVKTEAMRSPWVFPSPSGDKPSQSTTFNSLVRISEKLGVSVSPYCMRHTFISLMKNDVPETIIKAIVGHSVSMDTFGTYGHAVNGELERGAAEIDYILKKINVG